jgi:hypothetical protein
MKLEIEELTKEEEEEEEEEEGDCAMKTASQEDMEATRRVRLAKKNNDEK